MNRQFADLITKLKKTMDKPSVEKVNAEQCQVEAEIVGYLLGRKIAMGDSKFVPQGIDNHTLPLRSLNRVATSAYIAFQSENKKVNPESSRQ